jgi:hypothetical protein
MTLLPQTCAACSGPLAESLARLGSVRCHDCREVGAPLTAKPDALGGVRELAFREGDGIAVALVWDPATDRVAVRVEDARTGDRFEFAVRADQALDAFDHPFAYARRPQRDTEHAESLLAFADAA